MQALSALPAFVTCRHGCRQRVTLETQDGRVLIWYRNYKTPDQWDAAPTPVEPRAATLWALCISHHEPMAVKPIRVRHSDKICSTDCEVATGADCRCSCGGANHGIRST